MHKTREPGALRHLGDLYHLYLRDVGDIYPADILGDIYPTYITYIAFMTYHEGNLQEVAIDLLT